MTLKRSVKLATTGHVRSASNDLFETRLSRPYNQYLVDWEDDNYVIAQPTKAVRGYVIEVDDSSLSNVATIADFDDVDVFATRSYNPIEYYVDSSSVLPVQQAVTYYVPYDDGLRPKDVNLQPRIVPVQYPEKLVLAHDASSLSGPTTKDNVYEVVEETLVGDTDPFGVVRQRRTVKDGNKASKQQEVLDLLIDQRQGLVYRTPTGSKVPALDLAQAKGLCREATRNRIDKRTGQQHIQYVYEGYKNDAKSDIRYPPSSTDYLSQARQIDVSPYGKSGKYLEYSSPAGGRKSKYSPSSTTTELLTIGTSLDPIRPRRRNRYSTYKSSKDYDTNIQIDLQPDYSYLDYLYSSREKLPTSYSSGSGLRESIHNKYKPTDPVDALTTSYNEALMKPFGLNYDDLEGDDGSFQTVQVDLGKRRVYKEGRTPRSDAYPKLTRKSYMDDLLGRGSKAGDLDYPRRSGMSKYYPSPSYDSGSYSYRRRRASLDDAYGAGGYSSVPSMAGNMAGVIVNDALDRLFSHGGTKVRAYSPPRTPYYSSSGNTDNLKSLSWKNDYDYGKEDRERERRKRERDAERELQMKKLENDYERQKRERERKDEERKREMELERKRRENERDIAHAEFERQQKQREREREKLRQERMMMDKKASQKFDPRVHTVHIADKEPASDPNLSRAKATEFDPPVATRRTEEPPAAPKKKMLAEVAEHDPGEVKGGDRDPGAWVGHGHFKDERVIFNSDKGYIYWTKPKGSLEVIYKNPEGLLAFNCKVEPKNLGMKIYEVREDAEVLISSGKKNEGALEFSAIDGVVVIVLETYEDPSELPAEYRLDWNLHV